MFYPPSSLKCHINIHTGRKPYQCSVCVKSFATDLVQHVNVPTHIHGHCLDLVVTRTDELDIRDLTVHGAVISDHSAVTLKLPYTRPKQMKKTVTSRNYRDINLENFKQDIMACNFVTTKGKT